MKNLILVILSFITFNCYSQEIVEIPQSELEEFFLAIDTLEQQDRYIPPLKSCKQKSWEEILNLFSVFRPYKQQYRLSYTVLS